MWRRRSPSTKESEKEVVEQHFRKGLGFDTSEKILHVCKCSFKLAGRGGFFGGSKASIHDGLLYGSTNYFSFLDPDHRKMQRKIPLELVTALRPGMQLNDLLIETADEKYTFLNLKNRDEDMGRLMEIWTQQGGSSSNDMHDPLFVGSSSKMSDPLKSKKSLKQGKKDSENSPGVRYLRMGGHKGLQANRMGTYIEQPSMAKDGYSCYKHIKGDWYLYYYKENKFWFVGSRVGKRSGWLYVQSEEKFPDKISKSWRFWDDSEKKWLTDKSIFCVHVLESEVEPSQRKEPLQSKIAPGVVGESYTGRRISHSGALVHQNDKEAVFVPSSGPEDTWFSALYSLYSHAENSQDNQDKKSSDFSQ
mmetsp:Transcript_21332/g.52211  ORF Transcript_21332/g.52211 Transcript_21332/m.52211 type:complete len:361 (+) Transcript_21332:235-1317(+)